MLNTSEIPLIDTFKAILDSSPENFVLISANHTILLFNRTLQEMISGYFNTDIQIGDDYRNYVLESTQNLYAESFQKALEGEIIIIQDEAVVGNTTVWFEYKMNPVYDVNNQLIGIALYIKNINAQKRAEISRYESEMKFRRIIETAPIAILIVDSQMTITLCNPETEKIFGYNHEEMINQHIDLLIPARFKQNHHQHTEEYLQSPRMYQMGAGRFIPSVTKDGKELIVEVSLNSFIVNGKQLVLAMIQDVTARIQNEIQLKEQVQILEKIAWQHSHEIRRPVANIKGLIDLINMDYEAVQSIPNWSYLEQEVESLDHIIHKIVADTYREFRGK
ncbi:PAS domain-containing protein [Flectobacillus roseus]|uniref:PAS domain-containing protein n=1 Tax=Flectobacillus roseus TaxID=502259 RepID=UPI0024B86CB5|nr:PAS domain S-box protein [Flectobacillus roseus]MDI9869023.1 PAS domain S-box protein [Flectobacillus roseus]